MSDDKNPVMGVITFGPAQTGLKLELKAESVTVVEPGELPTIDVPSIMRAAGYDEGLEAAAKLLEERMRTEAASKLELARAIRAMKRKP